MVSEEKREMAVMQEFEVIDACNKFWVSGAVHGDDWRR
jgi:hypothetical protein